MSNNKLISIIIPAYNAEQYIDKCLSSLIKQTYKNLEILVVNDGSKDRTEEKVRSFMNSDSRIVLFNKKNEGLSATRNFGLDHASGQYIMFLDSDDWMETNACQKALDAIEKFKCDIVIGSYIREYGNRSLPTYVLGDKFEFFDQFNMKRLQRRLVGLVKEELVYPQKIDSLVTAWGKLYKKEIIETVRFVDTKIIGTEDAYFNIQTFENSSTAVYLPDFFVHYRKTNEQSLTHQYKEKLVDRWNNLYSLIREHIEKYNKGEEFEEALRNRIALGLIGIGLNLVEDHSISYKNKVRELKRIISLPRYQESLGVLEMKYFKIHWRLFFSLAKRKNIAMLVILLEIMDKLRNKF